MLVVSGSLKLLCGPRIGRFLKAESGMVVARDWGTGRSAEFMFNGHRGLIRDDEKVRETIVVMAAQHRACAECL